MADAPNVKTFDIADMFSGVAYPTEVVTVYTNKAVAYELNKLSHEAADAIASKDEDAAKDIAERRDKLVRESEKFRYEIHLRDQSRDNKQNLQDAIRAEFPPEVDFLGREKFDPEADRAYVNRFWALFVEKIVAPDGAILAAPSESAISIFRGNAPDSEIEKVEAAIQAFNADSKNGFETLAQEHDFLSSASPEA